MLTVLGTETNVVEMRKQYTIQIKQQYHKLILLKTSTGE